MGKHQIESSKEEFFDQVIPYFVYSKVALMHVVSIESYIEVLQFHFLSGLFIFGLTLVPSKAAILPWSFSRALADMFDFVSSRG